MDFEFYLILISICTFILSLFFSLIIKNQKIAKYLIIYAIITQFIILVVRSYLAKHPPFTNMYETMILLPFLFSMRLVLWKKQIPGNAKYGVITLIIILDLIALILPEDMKAIKPLMPALNSLWMYIHVPSYFVAYSSMLVASIFAIILLFKNQDIKKTKELEKRLNEEVKISFFFLNSGMITGAIWAYFSWGTYWSWDTKEVWSLINILVLTYYFHLNKYTRIKKSLIVILTFLTIIFTYFGVTFILPGLHSYG